MDFNASLEAERIPLLRYARHLCGYNQDEAEDLVNATMLKAIEHQDQFDGRKIGGWLSTILRNMFYDSKRSLRNRRTHLDIYEITGLEYTTHRNLREDSNVEHVMELKQVIAAMEFLSKEHQRVLSMYALGYTCEEIATRENISIGTIKSRVFRARAMLARQLGETDGGV
jgi:RNA polymerase sigma factor (sigma-70 family)